MEKTDNQNYFFIQDLQNARGETSVLHGELSVLHDIQILSDNPDKQGGVSVRFIEE